MIFVVTLFTVMPMHGFLRGRSFFSPRPQGTHAERELIGWQEEINIFTHGVNYGSLSLMPIYSCSVKAGQLAGYFFGTDTLVVSGSQRADRGATDIMADYFGLPIDYQSTLSFAPRIANGMLDLNLYLGFDAWRPGVYLRVHSPLVHTTWAMNISEQVSAVGSESYPAGYMASASIPRSWMMRDALEYFRGISSVGDIQPLAYGRIDGEHSYTSLADIEVAAGWNFINHEDYHFGVNVRTTVPTGNVPTSLFLFEPIVGNGGHWGLGFGCTGHSFFWDSPNGKHSFALYGDLNLMHLFSSDQRRSFDFRYNGAVSRYILLESVGSPVVQGLILGEPLNPDSLPIPDEPAQQQYHGILLPAVNVTTFDAKVSIALEADLVLKVAYFYGGYNVDLGYDFWARTSERIERRQFLPSNSFAVKGDAQVYGFAAAPPQGFVALNATQSTATMFAGQGDGNADFTNTNADNPAQALFGAINLTQATGDQVFASKQAIILSDGDIDNLSAASPAALSHTLFVHAAYVFNCFKCGAPFVGAGAEYTVDGSGTKRHSALSEWAIWVKTGVSF
jgi:hypothetical protein